MGKAKKIFLVVGIVILLALIALFVYIKFFAKSFLKPDGPFSAEVIENTTYSEIEQLKVVTDDNGNKFYLSTNSEYSSLCDNLYEIISDCSYKGIIILADDDEIIFCSGVNANDTDGNIVGPYTTFEIGSVTKSFTAVAIMRLVDEGKISLDDTLSNYYDNFPNGDNITLRNLLNMQSGLVDSIPLFEDASDEEIFDALYKSEQSFAPGTDMAYTNLNYVLLANIIEKTTGKAYGEYIKEIIFDKLSMNYSSSQVLGDVTSECQDGYFVCTNLARGAGDIHSNALDMIAFDRAVFNQKIITSDSFNFVTTPADNNGYGAGWIKEGSMLTSWMIKNAKPTDLLFHTGGTQSYHTYNMVFKPYDSEKRIYLFSSSGYLKDLPLKLINEVKDFEGYFDANE